MSPPASSEGATEPEPAVRRISAYSSRPDKTVFTESGNPDGWIATDFAVDIQR